MTCDTPIRDQAGLNWSESGAQNPEPNSMSPAEPRELPRVGACLIR